MHSMRSRGPRLADIWHVINLMTCQIHPTYSFTLFADDSTISIRVEKKLATKKLLSPSNKSAGDKCPRHLLNIYLFSPIFLSTLYSFRDKLEFFPLRCCRLVARFTRDTILTSSAVVLVRYWLVFLNLVRILHYNRLFSSVIWNLLFFYYRYMCN